ncbi:MAG TPA: TonB-dependent receptor [Acidobacteriota bacterium]|nr:TonB-dependent receptor [Acidobacteriota bacterium]
MRRDLIATLSLLLLCCTFAMAQVQVGSITGVVKSPQGEPVARAVVTATSPVAVENLQSVTDESGSYRFTHLKPGTYKLMVKSDNYQYTELPGIRVTVNAKLRIDIQLQEVGEQVIVITGETPLIETGKTSWDRVLTSEVLQQMPIFQRDFTEAIQILPGITPQVDGNMRGPSINGGRGRQVVWVVDGVENVDDYQGLNALYVSQDSIEEIEVIQSGFSVEYGRGSAGVVNVVTKAGTDEFHGKLYSYYRDDSFDDHQDEPFRWKQLGIQFSGPIVKNKTHFLGQFEYTYEHYVTKNMDPWGDIKYYDRNYERKAYQFRLDHRLMDNNVLSAKIAYMPYDRFFPSSWSIYPVRDATVYNYDNNNVTINDRHVFGEDDVLESTFQFSQYEMHKGKNADVPSDYIYYRWQENGVWQAQRWGNTGDADQVQRTYQLIEKWKHYHKLSDKSGMDWTVGLDLKRVGFHYDYDPTYAYYYYLNYSPSDANPIPYYKQQNVGNMRISGDTTMVALYVQNDWKISNRLTFNFGLRFDYNSFWGFKDFSPRAGFAYDITGDGKTLLRGGVGVYKDRDILFRMQQVNKPTNTYFYPILVNGQWDGTSWSKSTPVTTQYFYSDDMGTPYVIDVSLGIERELIPNWRVSATYNYKRGEERWFSKWENLRDPDTGKFPDPTSSYKCFYGNEGKSRFHSVIFELYKRYADNYQFSISYTWSRSRGNGYHYTSFLDQWVMHEPSLEDWRLGQFYALNNDVPHQFKASGLVTIPKILLNVAGTFRWRNGYPFTAQNYATSSLVGEINGYRNPNYGQLDMRFDRQIKLGRFSVTPKIDIFNLTNRENVTSLFALENYATFLQPSRWGPHRQLQIGIDFMW